MQVTTKWNIGQFLTEIVADVNTDRIPDALAVALRHEGQRCTAIDKVLGGFEKGADGKEKRRASYKRNEVEYTPELAQTLADTLKAFLLAPDKDENDKEIPSLFADVSIELPTKYEGGGAEPKFASQKTAIADYLAANGGKLKDGSARSVASFCANRGIEPPTDAAKYAEDTEFLLRVKAWQKSVNSAE